MSIEIGSFLGQYIVEQRLSDAGGTSQIFLAHKQQQPKHKAAVKVHLANDDNGIIFQNLLSNEIAALRTLRHPGIVRIYPLHIDGRTVYRGRAHEVNGYEKPSYFAMEFLGHDNTLDRYLKAVSSYDVEWGLELFYQILTTVHYMHQKGYAHCDLKPENIFLRYAPDPHHIPLPILADFGSAAKISAGITQLTASLRYSPPEVLVALERKDMTATHIRPDKVDVWALGAILFEILTGRPMIKGHRRSAITTTIVRGEFDRVIHKRRDRHDALESLDKVITRMVHPEAVKRPPLEQIIQAIEERITSVIPPRIPTP